MHQRDIAQRPDFRHPAFRLRTQKPHVVQTFGPGPVDQIGTLGTGADQQKGDVASFAQQCGGVEHIAERMRHAMRAEIADHAGGITGTGLSGQLMIARGGRITPQINAIDDDGDFLAGNTPFDQVVLERLGQRDHAIGVAVHFQFQLFNQP